jgi:hypothetical protein
MAAESSILSNLSGYIDRVAKLARLDATLLSIETKQNLIIVGITLGLFVAALATGFLGLVILTIAVVFLLIQLGMTPALSALLVALALFCVAAALVFIGIERLKGWSLMPRRTMAQFTSNLQALRTSLRHDTNS